MAMIINNNDESFSAAYLSKCSLLVHVCMLVCV